MFQANLYKKFTEIAFFIGFKWTNLHILSTKLQKIMNTRFTIFLRFFLFLTCSGHQDLPETARLFGPSPKKSEKIWSNQQDATNGILKLTTT